MGVDLCPSCKSRPKKKHWNSKWCSKCANERRKRPVSTMTMDQINWVNQKIGQMPISEMAEELGVSISNIKRAFRGKSIWFKNGKYKQQPELVKTVCEYYSKHGKINTQKRFPNVNVRSVVEHFKLAKPRQIRWTEPQIIAAARMAGLVSMRNQAKLFKRPGAFEGSIKSLWIKKFGFCSGNIHGLSATQAKFLTTKDCPYLNTQFWRTRRARIDFSRKLYLWVDIKEHLKNDTPDFIKEAVATLAKFQIWIFKPHNPRDQIKNLLSRNYS